jgi:hypothetical protein
VTWIADAVAAFCFNTVTVQLTCRVDSMSTLKWAPMRPIVTAAAMLLALTIPRYHGLRADPIDGPRGYAVACSIHSSSDFHPCTDLPSAKYCIEEMSFASAQSRDPTGMTFVNRSNEPIKIYWLDFRAMRTLYRFLPPGDKISQQTYIGHNWLVSTMADQCIGIFKAAPESIAFF